MGGGADVVFPLPGRPPAAAPGIFSCNGTGNASRFARVENHNQPNEDHMVKPTTVSANVSADRSISLETGKLAKQAGGSVVVRSGDTMVLCTAVLAPDVREGQSFFPLSVDYREKYAAGGKMPGGFIKREGRPTDKEILSARIIDRGLRPLFHDGFLHEVQVIVNVISADPEVEADVLGSIGSSAALMLAGAPFHGPIASVRIGRIGGQFVINPTYSQLDESDFNLVVSGSESAIVMVEGEMKEVSEEAMVDAFELAHTAIKTLCQLQHDLVKEAAGTVETMTFAPIVLPDGLQDAVNAVIGQEMGLHVRKPYHKSTFYGGVDQLKDAALDALLPQDEYGNRPAATEQGWTAQQIKIAVGEVESHEMREMILADGRRIDGRSTTDIRNIWCEVGYLPRVHGSAVFTRGETQVLASVTLGTKKDAQAVDQIYDTTDKRFFLHYAFPPFSTGEVKRMFGVSRREVGHGFLAERSIAQVLPSLEDFPYTIRINADVLESNGSSSMASVCGGILALMDAGVPIEKPVAGIAMGLITDGKRVAVLSDILGTEDHLGDMDFKVTGTADGITGCQMDIKVTGLSRDVLTTALHQAKEGRLHILGEMAKALDEPREDLSAYAPRLTTLQIDTEFIGAIIGPGGKVIQGLQRETGTKIDIEERDGFGFVTIAATEGEGAERAINFIKGIVTKPEPGENYKGTVKGLLAFGAIVEILPGKEGMLHVSEMDWNYVEKPDDYVQVGDQIDVQVLEIRDDGKVRLTRKPFMPKPEPGTERRRPEGDRPRRDDGDRRGGRRDDRGRGGDRPRGDRDRRDDRPRRDDGDRPRRDDRRDEQGGGEPGE